MALLSPELLARLTRLRLGSRRRVPGAGIGSRPSPRRGQSQEFADHRPYVPGDDLRFLDWHVFARLDALWVKLFEEETDRVVQLLVDRSASMEGEKLDAARRLAAAIGWIALGNTDRVLLAGLEARVAEYLPAGRSRRHAPALFHALEALGAGGNTALSDAIAALPRQRGGSMALLFTDLLSPEGHEAPLRRLVATGAEVHLFHVVAPWELRPELRGEVMLVDSETGEEVPVSLDDAALDQHQARVLAWLEDVETTARSLGVSYHRVSTAAPVEALVLQTLRQQGLIL
ncbi:MAG: DUF58 domain-containing protein [Deltaproteobacteria bacterium]|nr:DUF58 domain-containing protein [Deltaproteobacteria bacterium]